MDLPELLVVAFDVTMKLANLLLEYLKVLAWPLAVVSLALLYRRSLIGVLERLRKASGWGATLELENQVRELANESAELAVEAEQTESPSSTKATGTQTPPDPEAREPLTMTSLRQKFPQLTAAQFELKHGGDAAYEMRLNPAFVDATTRQVWRLLEKETAKVATRLGLTNLGSLSVITVLVDLANRHLVSPETIDIAVRLYNVRNRIKHDRSETLSSPALDDFVETTRNLISILQSASTKLAEQVEDDPEASTRP